VASIPTAIGRYFVENLVGIGGMGQIFKAHDPEIHRSVAIKLISTELMSGANRAEYIRRFRREAQAAARCAHPNIVAIYDFALHEGQPFIAMEFVYGVSLRQALDAAPVMAVPDAIGIMLQVLDALASAHALGVIHQDIKPANIMLTPEMRVKVADFGISRFVNTDVTSTSSSMGTPNYMSPEQCRGSLVDGRSDLFSAGATLFEMVTGDRAFPGHNVGEVSHRIQNERLPLLPAPVRAVAPRLQFVLERAMEKQPDDRFHTGDEMAEALRQVLGGSRDGEGNVITRISPAGGVAGGTAFWFARQPVAADPSATFVHSSPCRSPIVLSVSGSVVMWNFCFAPARRWRPARRSVATAASACLNMSWSGCKRRLLNLSDRLPESWCGARRPTRLPLKLCGSVSQIT